LRRREPDALVLVELRHPLERQRVWLPRFVEAIA